MIVYLQLEFMCCFEKNVRLDVILLKVAPKAPGRAISTANKRQRCESNQQQ
jgi:hypothetical protein